MVLHPEGHLAESGDIFVTTGVWSVKGCGGVRAPLTFCEWRPGILLKILQCIRQPLITKNYPIQNVNSADTEKTCAFKIDIFYAKLNYSLYSLILNTVFGRICFLK